MPKVAGQTVIVTGGAGFIGSRLTERLVSDSYDVIAVDNLSTGSEENIPQGTPLYTVDISQMSEIETLPDVEYKAIFHVAAQSSGEISFEQPVVDLNSNALGTLNMLRFAMSRGVPRFVYASSMGVYGDVADAPISETHPCVPASYYGITKLAGEQYVRLFSQHIDTTAFRLSNVYGPKQNLKNMKQGMASIYMAYLLSGEPLIVKGPAERFRDFVYIDDVVDAWLSCLDDHRTYGKVYNLGTGVKTTVTELIQVLLNALGYDSYDISYESGTPGDQFGIYADISKLQAELGFTTATTLDAGISRMVEWAKRRALEP